MSSKSAIPSSSQKRSRSNRERGGTGMGARSMEPRRQTSSQNGKSDMSDGDGVGESSSAAEMMGTR